MSDFATIYQQEHGRVFAFLLARSANWHVAEDLTADVFLAAFEKRGIWEDRGIPYSHYLRRMAHYQHGNYWRRERRRANVRFLVDDEGEERDEALLHDGGIEAVLDQIDTAMAAAMLRAALPRMRPRPLRAIALRYGLGLPDLECARRMGIGYEAFRALRRGAIERLQQLMLGREPKWTAKNAKRRQ